MSPHNGRTSVRPTEPIMQMIFAGRAWTARRIQNNCLRQHCHAVGRNFRCPEFASLKATCARVFEVLETRSRVLLDIHPTELAIVPAVVRLGAYADQWLRPPENWNPNPHDDARGQWAHLLRHLLANYSVPQFLDSAWFAKGDLCHFERDCWCALGFGRSLRMVHGFPASVSNRVLHHALTRADETSLPKAIWSAQLQRLVASPSLSQAILNSRVPRELSSHAFWVRLVAKFVAATDVEASQFALVADSLSALTAHRGDFHCQELLRLPLPSLTRHCVRFVTELLKANGHLLTDQQVRHAAEKAELSRLVASRWQPLVGSGILSSSWRVDELCTLDELRAEGRAMRHCVSGYAQRCKNGSSAIFSVRRLIVNPEGEREAVSYATIEVQPRTRKIVQIRAFGNRPANNSTMNLIREWAKNNDLRC